MTLTILPPELLNTSKASGSDNKKSLTPWSGQRPPLPIKNQFYCDLVGATKKEMWDCSGVGLLKLKPTVN